MFTVEELVTATKGKLINNLTYQDIINSISIDSRNISGGQAFIALKGESFDGHNYLQEVKDKGAKLIIISSVDCEIPTNIMVILVENTLKALQDIAQFHRQRFDIPLIAVTGSNGKTSTKDFIAAILGVKFNVLKTEGNFNNEIGLPLTLLKLNSSHEVAVVEMGMRGIGQIRELASIARPNYAVVTNVAETHLELLGSIENIAKAKGELVEDLPKHGICILNGDDKLVRRMQSKAQDAKIILYGINERTCDYRANSIQTNEWGCNFTCTEKNGECFEVKIPAIGIHNVYNCLAAIALAREVKLTTEEIIEGASTFKPSAMRQHIEKVVEVTIINDAYNASPISMTSAFNTLCELGKNKRKVAVLGDMLELGDFTIEAHQKIGLQLAEMDIDMLIGYGPYMRYAVEKAQQAGLQNVLAVDNHREIACRLKEYLQKNDVVLVKGSRGMKMEQVIMYLKEIM